MQKEEKILNEIFENPSFRKELIQKNFFWFHHVYLSHHLQYPTGEFQKDMIEKISNEKSDKIAIVGFPKCGKTLITSLSFTLWQILSGKSKSVMIVCGNKKASSILAHKIKNELNHNKNLKEDFTLKYSFNHGRFIFSNLHSSIYITHIEADECDLEIGMSSDLIIVDGMEKRKKDNYAIDLDRIQQMIDSKTPESKIIITGRFCQEDCLMHQIREYIKEIGGLLLRYPLIKDATEDEATWPEKFNDIELLKKEINKISCGERGFFNYMCLDKIPKYMPELIDAKTKNFAEFMLDWTEEEKVKAKYLYFGLAYSEKLKMIIGVWGLQTEDFLKIHQVFYRRPIFEEHTAEEIMSFAEFIHFGYLGKLDLKIFCENKFLREKIPNLPYEPLNEITITDYEKVFDQDISFEHLKFDNEAVYRAFEVLNIDPLSIMEAMLCGGKNRGQYVIIKPYKKS